MTRPNRADLATDPRARDVTAALAARAHADAERRHSDAQTALANGRSRRTAHRWRTEGHGSPADRFGQYMLATPDPWRLVAHTKALAKRRALESLTRAELIERYHAILAAEKQLEADDTRLDLTRGSCWLDRAQASERDAALDEEKAAIERRFAELGIKDAEVWG